MGINFSIMKKSIKQINDQLKALYENREQGYLEEDDKRILRYERQGLETKERWDNYTPAEKENILGIVRQANHTFWSSKAIYVLRSPGVDLLDYYDAKWQEYVDNLGVNGGLSGKNHGRNQIGLIPPSVVYKLRFCMPGPKEDRKFKDNAWKLLSKYVDRNNAHIAYHLEVRNRMYSTWLTQENSVSYEFNILEELYDFMDDHLNMKVHHGEIRPHSDKNYKPDTVWWRKEAAGWSIITQ